ncbi:ethanolamine ammonia-lyase subunit EutB [Corynebacterium sp. 335C]
MTYAATVGTRTYRFTDLAELLAKASPQRSGDELAGCAAESAAERVAAQMALADVPLTEFRDRPVIDPDADCVSRVIAETHDDAAFAAVSHLTVGGFREWLLDAAYSPDAADVLAAVAPGVMPEMAAAVSKLMGNEELVHVASAVDVVTRFRTTVGGRGRLATRLQPNHPTDDPLGVAASILDGLLLGAGDAVIGINPASDSPAATRRLLELVDEVRLAHGIPTQSCVLSHITTTLKLIEDGAPVDLPFQSIGGTEGTLRGFGVELAMPDDALAGARELRRGTVGDQVMYFETGQGSSLSADAHRTADGRVLDQQTLEARAYGLARAYDPFLVNTVVGFIGPEYLHDGRQIIRAGLEDNFCGKLLGIQMGVDVCYTNHAEAASDDMDVLLHLLASAGTGFVITVPGSDDVMLGYQSPAHHDVAMLRSTTGLRPAPEFEEWLEAAGITRGGRLDPAATLELAAPGARALGAGEVRSA